MCRAAALLGATKAVALMVVRLAYASTVLLEVRGTAVLQVMIMMRRVVGRQFKSNLKSVSVLGRPGILLGRDDEPSLL